MQKHLTIFQKKLFSANLSDHLEFLRVMQKHIHLGNGVRPSISYGSRSICTCPVFWGFFFGGAGVIVVRAEASRGA